MKCLHVAAALYFYNDTDIVIKSVYYLSLLLRQKFFSQLYLTKISKVFEKRGHRAKPARFYMLICCTGAIFNLVYLAARLWALVSRFCR